jgi:hypothetical protein
MPNDMPAPASKLAPYPTNWNYILSIILPFFVAKNHNLIVVWQLAGKRSQNPSPAARRVGALGRAVRAYGMEDWP